MESNRSLVERIAFNWPSVVLHTIWFVLWFYYRLDVGLLTNVVSLEAIYLTLLIGIGTGHVHGHVDKLHNKVDKNHEELTLKTGKRK